MPRSWICSRHNRNLCLTRTTAFHFANDMFDPHVWCSNVTILGVLVCGEDTGRVERGLLGLVAADIGNLSIQMFLAYVLILTATP